METVMAHCGKRFDASVTAQNEVMTNFINLRMATFWNWGPWPEWTYSEQRAFAHDWISTFAYLAGATVYLPTTGLYYTALQNSQGKSPDTETDFWGPGVLTVREVYYEQYGKTKIGTAWKATNRDSLSYDSYCRYAMILTATGIRFPTVSASTLWLKYSPPAPRFTSTPFSATPTVPYALNDLVFYPGDQPGNFPHKGEAYQALYDANGDQAWIWVPFPAVALGFVALAAAADLQLYYGKTDESDKLNDRADKEIAREASKAGIGPEIMAER